MVCLTYVDGVAATSAAVQLKHVRERNLTFFHLSFFYCIYIYIYIYIYIHICISTAKCEERKGPKSYVKMGPHDARRLRH